MWNKELWEGRWRVPILTGSGWLIAVIFPLLFGLIHPSSSQRLPHSMLLLLQYPHFAYGWFGEDLPEILLVAVVAWAYGSIAREWQSGTVEFLAQLPLTRWQVAWRKAVIGTGEVAFIACSSSAVLWLMSLFTGHYLPIIPYVLSVVLITVGFIGVLWLMSAVVWLLHSGYSVMGVGLGIFVWSVITASVPAMGVFSPLKYIANTSPYAHLSLLWEHLALAVVMTIGVGLISLWVAGNQEFVPYHGRDQL